MKIKNLILLFCLSATISLFAQKEPKNYIEGDYKYEPNATNTAFNYTLTGVTSKGIKFRQKNYYLGKRESDGAVKFTFSDAVIPCSGAMEFYKQDEAGRWQRDSEAKVGTASFSSSKSMVVMLVLDCSGSLGDDFAKIKDYAKQFVSTLGLQSNHEGNIHIGIVGFSSMENTFIKNPVSINSIAKVNELNYYISNLKQSKQTALYYAMRRGYESIEKYVSTAQSDPEFNFNGSFLVTFTDGLDNASLDIELGVGGNGEDDPYYQYVKNMLSSKEIGGKKVSSYMIALEGKDVTDWNAFTTPLEKLANDGQFFSAKYGQFDDVQNAFRNIASNLVQQWMDLNCYIPPKFIGKCRWVLRCNDEPEPEPEPEPAPAPKKVSLMEAYSHSIGAIVGNLLGVSYKYISYYKPFAFQLDAGSKFVDGCSIELDANFLYQNYIKRWEDYRLDWFIGGGFSSGFNVSYDAFSLGLNAMLGMEFMFDRIPLTLQLDFRPGLGVLDFDETFFDYAIGIGVRYTW